MEADMNRIALRVVTLLFVQTLAVTSFAHAQGGLSQAVLSVSSTFSGSDRNVDGRLYGGAVVATIYNHDSDPKNFSNDDLMTLRIGPRGQKPILEFSGNSEAFEGWARDHASELLGILFPAGMPSMVMGHATSELQGQEALLATAFSIQSVREMSQGGRATAGGMIEYETFKRDGSLPGDSSRAVQGMYNLGKTVSLHGRYVQQHEGFTTRATSFSVDYHPYVEIDKAVRFRVGGTARGGLLYSRSNAMDLGSLEFGGGGWVSAFKDLGPVRIGGGTMLQGSKSYLPPVFSDEDLSFLAEAINDRGIQYDLSYGGTVGVDTSSRTTIIVKLFQNHPLSSSEVRPDSWQVLSGLSYRFGLPSVNVGYKYYSTTGLHSHSVFAQGNFNW
jgi:hypothetical protein